MTSIVKVDEIQNNAGTTTLAKIENGQLTGVLSPATGFRNRIINGNMVIAQRGTSVTGLQNSPAYLVDRFSYRRSGVWATATYTYSQIGSISLSGFENAARLTVTATETPSGDAFASLDQWIEGFNVADLGWGTANAQPVTVSFWVRSSVTGTFSVAVSNISTRSYVAEYSISSPNTWEYKTITVEGDTSGAWTKQSDIGVGLSFTVASSSTGGFAISTLDQWQSANVRASTTQTNISVTNGATWDITGVQLEKGTVATPFEFRSIGQELGLCQRYFEKFGAGSVASSSTNANAQGFNYKFQTTKRAAPTITHLANYNLLQSGIANFTATATSGGGSITGGHANVSVTPAPPSVGACLVYTTSTDNISASAEL